jgi:hypothetical protein
MQRGQGSVGHNVHEACPEELASVVFTWLQA